MADDGNVGLGFVGVAVAIVFFGSNFLPIKKFDAGDGFYFQWILCAGIWLCGFVCGAIEGFTEVPRPCFVMVGGMVWCVGNCATVYIVRHIGMGLGLGIWGGFNLIIGVLSGLYGWFGLKKEEYTDEKMPFVMTTICLTMLTILLYATVEPNKEGANAPSDGEMVVEMEAGALTHEQVKGDDEMRNVGLISDFMIHSIRRSFSSERTQSFMIRLVERVPAVLLACGAGTLYGFTFTPAFLVYHNDEGAPQNILAYVFWTFCGMFLMSSAIFMIYALAMKNKPYINVQLTFPALISGVMWGVACIGWFIANKNLGFSIAFPLINSGPCFVGFIWGMFLYREVTGLRNYIVLGIAFAILCTACGMCVIAKS